MRDLGFLCVCVCVCVWPFLLSVISAQDDGIVDTNYFGIEAWNLQVVVVLSADFQGEVCRS